MEVRWRWRDIGCSWSTWLGWPNGNSTTHNRAVRGRDWIRPFGTKTNCKSWRLWPGFRVWLIFEMRCSQLLFWLPLVSPRGRVSRVLLSTRIRIRRKKCKRRDSRHRESVEWMVFGIWKVGRRKYPASRMLRSHERLRLGGTQCHEYPIEKEISKCDFYIENKARNFL